jgi:hypothetical protein
MSVTYTPSIFRKQSRSIQICFVIAATIGVSTFVVVPTSTASAAPVSTAIGVLLPLPEAAGPVPNAVANDVWCSSAGACTAVGDYQDTIGITHGVAETLSSGMWTATAILAPNNAPDYTFADLNAVSCVSAGNCVAVGDYRVSTIQTESFYAVETSGAWARGLELSVPADADTDPAETSFDSVSCVSSGNCQLLGIYAVTPTSAVSPIHAVVDSFKFGTGLVGSPTEITQAARQSGIDLNSISCTNPGSNGANCVAVGAQVGQFTQVATYVEENDGVWGTPTDLANPKGGRDC